MKTTKAQQKIAAHKAAWYQRNKAERDAKHVAYVEANREAVARQKAAYYQEQRMKMRAHTPYQGHADTFLRTVSL